ncbi:unnamed protein product [Arabis nemorensis]|uniref:SGNH hydrolase-type esterase domain-containing protein n=1 Tax=Arabis nemorensis TaxID=586526 RepID=A0A565B258_9BRAS|nr:unnamed protein product [Arabis nemorensis]
MERSRSLHHHIISYFFSSSSSIRFWCIFVLVLLLSTITTNALVKIPENVSVPAIIVFGDSIVDAGNNDDMITEARCDYPPYGIDFDGGVPTGRFSNGKVPTDILAEELGIKPNLPAYRDPNLKPEELLTGVTFASGGAGYVPLTTKIAGGIPLSQQLKLFEEYIVRLNGMVGKERTKFIIRNSLFVVICGSNDIANDFFALPPVQLIYDVASFTALMADNARSFATTLHGYGARRILIFGAPPIGCVPSQRTVAGGPTRDCVVRFNDACKIFNTKLSANIDGLSRTLQDATLLYIDIYTPLLDLILNPQQYGFKVSNKGCCGTGLIEVTALCNNYTATTTTNALVKLPPNKTIPAVIVFGDSIVDAGNNDDIIKTLARCNYPPYGIDFDGGVPTGRFSNGKVPTDIIAEEYGIKPSIPAYRDPNLKPEDLLTGVTFASGGCGYVPFTAQVSGGIPLSQQLKLFQEYIEKLKEMVGEERTKFIIENSLFMVVSGSNDITNTYFGLPYVQSKYDVASFTTLMADNARSFVQKLHEFGARRIQVFSAPPLGCVPSQRTIAGGSTRTCVDRFNDATKLYNAKLYANLDSLSRTLDDKTLIYIDIYDSLFDIILNPQQYGFKVVDKGCCGTGYIEVAILCNNYTAEAARTNAISSVEGQCHFP